MINTTNSVVTDTTYYVYTDHLGSLALVTGEDKSVLQENDFDAWGRKRNPTDWSFNSVPTANLFDRGYTGHEHLDIFGLINMNGRMYDPVLGKMLSPDLVVQDPGYTESYNRYTYCFNNPLKFTDPSGYEGEGWSQGVWNSHNVDWNAIGWYDMSIEERSAWYAGNVYNVNGNGIQSTGSMRPDYLGNLANQYWDNKDQMDRAMRAEGLYWNAYDQQYGTYEQQTQVTGQDTKGTRDPSDDKDIISWVSVFIPGDYSIFSGDAGGGRPGIGGPSDLHSGFAGGPGEKEKKKSATESVMPFVMTAAAVDGPFPFGEVIGGGILSIALTIDLYYAYMGDPKDWTYTYQPPSQNPIHRPPTGFDPKNTPDWKGPVKWLLLAKTLIDLHNSLNNSRSEPKIEPAKQDKTYYYKPQPPIQYNRH